MKEEAHDRHRQIAELLASRAVRPQTTLRFALPELDGRAAAAAWIDVFLRAFPDLHHDILASVEADNQVAAEVRFTGSHTGPLASPSGDIAPTGKPVILDYADILRFTGEQLQSEHVYFDQAAFLTQLGLLPA